MSNHIALLNLDLRCEELLVNPTVQYVSKCCTFFSFSGTQIEKLLSPLKSASNRTILWVTQCYLILHECEGSFTIHVVPVAKFSDGVVYSI